MCVACVNDGQAAEWDRAGPPSAESSSHSKLEPPRSSELTALAASGKEERQCGYRVEQQWPNYKALQECRQNDDWSHTSGSPSASICNAHDRPLDHGQSIATSAAGQIASSAATARVPSATWRHHLQLPLEQNGQKLKGYFLFIRHYFLIDRYYYMRLAKYFLSMDQTSYAV